MNEQRARQAIEAARKWQNNSELCIAAEIVEDLIDELEARLPPLLTEEESQLVIGAIPLQALPDTAAKDDNYQEQAGAVVGGD